MLNIEEAWLDKIVMLEILYYKFFYQFAQNVSYVDICKSS